MIRCSVTSLRAGEVSTSFDALLHDLTSRHFAIDASNVADDEKRRHGSFAMRPSTASFWPNRCRRGPSRTAYFGILPQAT